MEIRRLSFNKVRQRLAEDQLPKIVIPLASCLEDFRRMASWTLRPTPVVAGQGPALVAEEGVMARPPRLHHPPHQGGKLPSTSTSRPPPETRPENDGHAAHQAAAPTAPAGVAAEAATMTATTATTTATVPDALHDALQAVARVDLAVAAVAAVTVEIPMVSGLSR